MSFFQKEQNPFSDELKKLEAESRRVEEKMRRLEAQLGEPLPDPVKKSRDPEQFKGATFKGDDQFGRQLPPTRSSLKIQKRKIRNRVILLGAVLLILILLVFKTLA